MKKYFQAAALFSLSVLAAAAALLLPNLFLTPGPLPSNDLHLAWLISPGRFFIAPPGSLSAGGELLATNPELSRLGNGTDTFFRVKPPGVFRIFCVGGSTTRGWPFQKELSYPFLLAGYLKEALPSVKTEVINAGFLASDSFSDLALVRELMTYQPDLLLVYEGRNDAWNHSLHSGYMEPVLKLHIFLSRRLSAYGLLRTGFIRNKENFDHGGQIRKLAYVTGGNFRRFESGFKTNLGELARAAAAGQSRIIFINQVEYPDGTAMENNVSRTNAWLKEYAAAQSASWIDLNGEFKAVPGKEGLLIPPPIVHPDVNGYCLMARTALDTLRKSGILAPGKAWKPSGASAEKACLKNAEKYSEGIKASYGRVGSFFAAALNPAAAAYYRRQAENYPESGK